MNNSHITYYWEERGQDSSWVFSHSVEGYEGARKFLVSVIQPGESVLDIGCGIGTIYGLFQKHGIPIDYLGIDLNPVYLQEAQKYFPDIQTRPTDMNFLPWVDNSFDTSILFTVIECVPDFRKVLDEAWRISRKRIIIAISVELVDRRDENAFGVSDPPIYIVRINRKKFLDYMYQFTSNIQSGEFSHNNHTEYWWWILEKS